MQAPPAPVGHHERRNIDLIELRGALAIPVIEQRVLEELAVIIGPVGSELLGAQTLRPRIALVRIDVRERAIRATVLVAEHAAGVPAIGEAAAEHTALAR